MARGRRQDFEEDLFDDELDERFGRFFDDDEDEPEEDDEDDPQGEFEDDDDPDAEGEEDPDDEEDEEEPRGRNRNEGSLVNRVKSQMGQRITRLVQELRGAGLDLQRGRLVVRNPALLQGAFGQPAQQQPQQQQTPAPEPEEQLGEMPNPVDFPEEWAAWMEKRDGIRDKKHQAQLKQVVDTIGQQFGAPVQRREIRGAIDMAEEVLDKYNLGHLLEHPDFDEEFGKALAQSGIPVANWSDESIVARVAGIVNAELALTQRRRRAPGREPEGRRRSAREEEPPRRRATSARREEPEYDRRRQRNIGRAAVSRAGFAQIGSSRGGGRAPERDGYTTDERRNAKLMGISPKEYRALGDETGESFVPMLRDQQRRRAEGSQPRARRTRR